MSKQLIIAEKPSVATDISKALGGFKKQSDYYESDDYVLTSAVGHLLEIGVPEEEEVKRGKWTFNHLPAIPSHFALKPIEKTQDRLKQVLKLVKRKDVSGLINACDAGREGELIFRYIVQYAKTDKPILRLWLQSMTQESIREGFAQLRTDKAMQPLAAAARSRSEADWLVGINGTRAMTAFNSKSGGFQLTTVGRVQTPTLAVVVEREEKIRAFVPRDYWEVHATFAAKAGNYNGRWFDEKFKKKDDEPEGRAERLWDAPRAQAIQAKCQGQTGEVSEESKPTTQASPLLYDLTSLQREANSRIGISARTTLQIAQALYEKHKVITYPRTDSRALPEDYIGTVQTTLKAMSKSGYGAHAQRVLKEKWVKPSKRVFDNAKVSDHFAIIPTLQMPKALNELETKLYDMIAKRFLAIFFPSAEFLQTTRITRVQGEAFKSEGKVLVNPGWLAVYGREAQEDDTNLMPVAKGEKVKAEEVKVVANQTKPPARYTEATLLSAMEGAGKLIEDDELREAMAAKGLGTPATRAAIIEGLITERYMLRDGRELVPTPKAFSLITLLRGLGVPELFSPELTADWEYKLGMMERGDMKREAFMREIADMTKHIVGQAKNYDSDTVPGDFVDLKSACPRCSGQVKENYKKFQCQKCDFAFWRIMGGRQIAPDEAEVLLTKGEVGPLDGFRSKRGLPFSAALRLNDKKEVEFYFGDQPNAADQPAPDFSGQEPVGACPKCKSRVFEMPNAYVCEKAVGPDKTCDFRSGRTILQRIIERAQMQKLLEEGKTALLHKFVSARTKRPFSAYLVRKPDGGIGFEFEKREPKKAAAATVAADKEEKPATKRKKAA
jgi:DNA topoisomerase-3